MSRRNPVLDAITRELDRARIEYHIEHSKHLKVRFEVLGRRQMVICSGTPKDLTRDAAARVRRMLREAVERKFERAEAFGGVSREAVA